MDSYQRIVVRVHTDFGELEKYVSDEAHSVLAVEQLSAIAEGASIWKTREKIDWLWQEQEDGTFPTLRDLPMSQRIVLALLHHFPERMDKKRLAKATRLKEDDVGKILSHKSYNELFDTNESGSLLSMKGFKWFHDTVLPNLRPRTKTGSKKQADVVGQKWLMAVVKNGGKHNGRGRQKRKGQSQTGG